MAEYFTFGPHLMVKAVRRAGIRFPASKADCMEKAGDALVQVDFDTFRPLRDVIAGLSPDYFVNNEAFYSAWVSANTKAALKKNGY